jgi:serine/threonine protein phosphatase PrpC
MIETCQHILGYRSICQDAVGVFVRAHSTVIVVADGAGGIEDGEVASRSVVDAVRQASLEASNAVDWVQVLRQVDYGIASGQSTACVVELGSNRLRGASVGDSGVAILDENDDLAFPSDGQQRKPLLGTREAVPKPFVSSWNMKPLVVGSDGFWNYVNRDRLIRKLHFTDFVVMAKSLAEMVRLPSGSLADDVSVVCARGRRASTPVARRIDLLEEM